MPLGGLHQTSCALLLPSTKTEEGQTQTFLPSWQKEKCCSCVLKRELMNPPVLAIPRSEGLHWRGTNYCDKQIGCVLLHEQEDGSNRPVGYWSYSSYDKEKPLAATQRKYLTAVQVVTLLRPYLKRARFVFLTNHKALRRISTTAEAIENWRDGT